jgi:hypothetical protein
MILYKWQAVYDIYGGRESSMRTLAMTLAAIALLTVSASAQQNPNAPGMSLPKVEHTPDQEHSAAPKVDDKAYRSALDGIPQVKDHDPWGNVREAPKSKKSAR